MTDTDQRGVAHVHPRLMPTRRRMDELMINFVRPDTTDFILPDHNTFGLNDLRDMVDNLPNEEGDFE